MSSESMNTAFQFGLASQSLEQIYKTLCSFQTQPTLQPELVNQLFTQAARIREQYEIEFDKKSKKSQESTGWLTTLVYNPFAYNQEELEKMKAIFSKICHVRQILNPPTGLRLPSSTIYSGLDRIFEQIAEGRSTAVREIGNFLQQHHIISQENLVLGKDSYDYETVLQRFASLSLEQMHEFFTLILAAAKVEMNNHPSYQFLLGSVFLSLASPDKIKAATEKYCCDAIATWGNYDFQQWVLNEIRHLVSLGMDSNLLVTHLGHSIPLLKWVLQSHYWNPDLVLHLIEHGAKLDNLLPELLLCEQKFYKDDLKPLHTALAQAIVERCPTAPQVPVLSYLMRDEIFELLFKKGFHPNERDQTQRTALMAVAERRIEQDHENYINPHINDLVRLLQEGATPTLQDKKGNNFLHYLVNSSVLYFLSTFNHLTKYINLDEALEQKNTEGKTPLQKLNDRYPQQAHSYQLSSAYHTFVTALLERKEKKIAEQAREIEELKKKTTPKDGLS